jgi:hypothetical protein
MTDIFGGLAGGPGDPDARGNGSSGPVDVPAPGTDAIAALEHAFDGAALWGLELDSKFRVLAATFEPTPERYAWAEDGGAVADRRVQLLCFPVSTILGSLRRESDDGRAILEFTEEQLVDVVAAFDGATVSSPLFGQPEPRPGQWAPRFSVQGRSSAPDGTRRTITLSLRHEDLALDLFARFDDLELKGPDGEDLAIRG